MYNEYMEPVILQIIDGISCFMDALQLALNHIQAEREDTYQFGESVEKMEFISVTDGSYYSQSINVKTR